MTRCIKREKAERREGDGSNDRPVVRLRKIRRTTTPEERRVLERHYARQLVDPCERDTVAVAGLIGWETSRVARWLSSYRNNMRRPRKRSGRRLRRGRTWIKKEHVDNDRATTTTTVAVGETKTETETVAEVNTETATVTPPVHPPREPPKRVRIALSDLPVIAPTGCRTRQNAPSWVNQMWVSCTPVALSVSGWGWNLVDGNALLPLEEVSSNTNTVG